MGSIRDAIRKAAADSTVAKMDVLEVDFGDGVPKKVGVLHPTVRQRRKFAEIGSTGAKKGEVNFNAATAMKIQAVIDCAVDVETRDPLWEHGDRDVLETAPAGGWVDKISDRVMVLSRGASAVSCECGADLAPGQPFCAVCGKKTLDGLEVAEKNS